MQTVIVGKVIGSSFGDPSRWFITEGYLKYKINDTMAKIFSNYIVSYILIDSLVSLQNSLHSAAE